MSRNNKIIIAVAVLLLGPGVVLASPSPADGVNPHLVVQVEGAQHAAERSVAPRSGGGGGGYKYCEFNGYVDFNVFLPKTLNPFVFFQNIDNGAGGPG